MALLTNRDQILKSSTLKTIELEVPEWGGSILLRELTGAQRDKFEASTLERKGKDFRQNLENLRARLVSLCVVNEQGELVFNPQDLRELGAMGAAGLDRVFIKCQELNGLGDKDVQELAEDLGNGRVDNLSTG